MSTPHSHSQTAPQTAAAPYQGYPHSPSGEFDEQQAQMQAYQQAQYQAHPQQHYQGPPQHYQGQPVQYYQMPPSPHFQGYASAPVAVVAAALEQQAHVHGHGRPNVITPMMYHMQAHQHMAPADLPPGWARSSSATSVSTPRGPTYAMLIESVENALQVKGTITDENIDTAVCDALRSINLDTALSLVYEIALKKPATEVLRELLRSAFFTRIKSMMAPDESQPVKLTQAPQQAPQQAPRTPVKVEQTQPIAQSVAVDQGPPMSVFEAAAPPMLVPAAPQAPAPQASAPLAQLLQAPAPAPAAPAAPVAPAAPKAPAASSFASLAAVPPSDEAIAANIARLAAKKAAEDKKRAEEAAAKKAAKAARDAKAAAASAPAASAPAASTQPIDEDDSIMNEDGIITVAAALKNPLYFTETPVKPKNPVTKGAFIYFNGGQHWSKTANKEKTSLPWFVGVEDLIDAENDAFLRDINEHGMPYRWLKLSDNNDDGSTSWTSYKTSEYVHTCHLVARGKKLVKVWTHAICRKNERGEFDISTAQIISVPVLRMRLAQMMSHRK